MFLVETVPEGGFTARAFDADIFKEADNLASLHTNVRDAMRCHFDDDQTFSLSPNFRIMVDNENKRHT